MRPSPSTPFEQIPGSLPSCSVPENVDASEIERLTLSKLNNLRRDDLAEEAILRDLVALSGTWRTFYSGDKVFSSLQTLLRDNQCLGFGLAGVPPRVASYGWIDISIVFDTRRNGIVGKGASVVSVGLFPDGQWRIWLLRTWLESFQGHGNPDTLSPSPRAVVHDDDGVYDAVIIGAGQAGLSNAGRLQSLGMKYVLLERYDNVGDVWRKRYSSLRWHTPKEYGNLPFGRTYLKDDEDMLPAARIADAHQDWTERYEINVRTGTIVQSARYNKDLHQWTIKTSSADRQSTLQAKNLILAIGPGVAYPVSPTWATVDQISASGYKGIILHAASYISCDGWEGSRRRGVVVGTGNTGHDVAEDMANAGMHTTMIQRGRTFIMPAEWLHGAHQKDYNEEKPVEQGDRDNYTYPIKIGRDLANSTIHTLIRNNPEIFDELEAAGFKVDRTGDLFHNLCTRLGGHYIDTGNGRRIADGEIKVVAKAIKGLDEQGLRFEDGSTLPADVIVLATGFDHDFSRHAATIVGQEIADQMDDYWGLDAEGELRGQGEVAGFPHLYVAGGDIRHARWSSRFIALQIQAELLGQRVAMSKL